MAISSYEENGQIFFKLYINIRSKTNPMIREQKVVKGLKTKTAAENEEKKLLRELGAKVANLETRGLDWKALLDAWELDMRRLEYNGLHKMTIEDDLACLRKWTSRWANLSACEITPADVREALLVMAGEGKSKSHQERLKRAVGSVFTWAIERRLLKGIFQSPSRGVKLGGKTIEKPPEIFSIVEIKKLLLESKRLEHSWYPIWAMALLTGMRNGELHALRWSDVDFETNRIYCTKMWNTRLRKETPTKGGYWRNIPISTQLHDFLLELKTEAGDRVFVLPRSGYWDKGWQAKILRVFCRSVGLPSIRFHTLRACFATQLLANGIASARIMKICGWKDMKTMQHYVRLAGIDEKGATESLKVLPSDLNVMDKVVSLFDFKIKRNGEGPEQAG